MTASPGITPRNRAVCFSCAAAFRFDYFVAQGSLREATRSEWLDATPDLTPPRTKKARRATRRSPGP
jgi:hypothetical protein